MSKLKSQNTNEQIDETRRNFLKAAGGIGVASTLAMFGGYSVNKIAIDMVKSQENYNFDVKRTVCLACHGGCGIQVTVAFPGTTSEKAIKIAGNPYHPNGTLNNLDYDTDPATLVREDGYPIISSPICAKGQAGLQALYDPKRLKHHLKRVGPRGSGKWQVIDYATLLDEICGSGSLPATLPSSTGEGTYTFDGMNDVYTGSNPNEFVFVVGRSEHGRKELTDRLWKNGFGTKNHRNDHTSICELSHHIAYAMAFPGKTHVGTDIMNAEYILWFGTSPLEAGFPMVGMANRLANAKFNRTNPLKMVTIDPRYSRTAAKSDLWLPVTPGADSALACGMLAYMFEKEWYDTAFLSNVNVATGKASTPKEYSATDATHLVIVQSGHANEGKFARPSDVGLVRQTAIAAHETEYERVTLVGGTETRFITVSYDESDEDEPEIDPQNPIVVSAENNIYGDLDDSNGNNLLALTNGKTSSVTVGGVECKTVFQLVKDMVWKPVADGKTAGSTIDDLLDYYADECGEYVNPDLIKELASEFWSHGKKSVANFYRGSVQHTNGTYAALALIYLNLFVGNVDHRGGLTTGGSHWHEMGGKTGNPYDITSLFGGTPATPTGLNIAREKSTYAGPFPAERPHFQHTSNVWQEVIAGIRHGEGANPTTTGFYQPKIVWMHMANPNYSMPGSFLATKMLTDVDPGDSTKYKVPLVISTDLVMGETAAYCDYIVADVSYLERWASPHIAPNIQIKASGVRQPVLSEPLYPDTVMAEQVYIDVAKKLNLPGVGDTGFGSTAPTNRQALNSAEDWYNKIIVNFALEGATANSGKVPKGDGTFYSITDWDTAVTAGGTALDTLEQTLIDYVLARGGVFNNHDTGYKDENDSTDHEHGQYIGGKWGKLINFYIEALATSTNPMTGDNFEGLGFYDTIKRVDGEEIKGLDSTKYPFMLSTYKSVLHTQSRTVASEWIMQIEGENGVLINDIDAAELNIKDGDMLKITSNTTEYFPDDAVLIGPAVVTKGIMKGVVSVSHSLGHFQYGSEGWEEAGKKIKGIKSRKGGSRINHILRLDDSQSMLDADGKPTVSLQDLIGGSACYYDTYVKIEKA